MRFVPAAATALLVFASVAEAQIPITRKANVDPSTRVLVPNAVADEGMSAEEALKVSNGVRSAFARIFAGKKTVITKDLIAIALKQFGYEPDEALPLTAVGQLADQLKAGLYVALTVKPGADGKLVAVATVNGKSPVTADGPNPGALAETLADRLKSGM